MIHSYCLKLLFLTTLINLMDGSMKDDFDGPSLRYATRILVYSCSADHFQIYFWDQFAATLAKYVNKFCRIDSDSCKSISWSENCNVEQNQVHLIGKPSEVDSNTVEVWIIVQSSCCVSDKKPAILSQSTILYMLSEYEEQVEFESHVHILHFDQSHKLGSIEYYLRTWCFTSGLGMVVAIIVLMRFVIKKQERRTAVSDYMQRTMQRTKRNVETVQRLQDAQNEDQMSSRVLQGGQDQQINQVETRFRPIWSEHAGNRHISTANAEYMDEHRKKTIARKYLQQQNPRMGDSGGGRGRSRVLMMFPGRRDNAGDDDMTFL